MITSNFLADFPKLNLPMQRQQKISKKTNDASNNDGWRMGKQSMSQEGDKHVSLKLPHQGRLLP
jgi:hypothetical protein